MEQIEKLMKTRKKIINIMTTIFIAVVKKFILKMDVIVMM